MDEFQPEDELKPDTSDRPGRRKSRAVTHEKKGITRQYLMTGIGIVVLLIIILGIGAAINGPRNKDQQADQGKEAVMAKTEPKPLETPAVRNSSPSAVEQVKAYSETANPESHQSVDLPAAGLPVAAATLSRSVKVQNQTASTTTSSSKHPNVPLQYAAKETFKHKKVVKNKTSTQPAAKTSPASQVLVMAGDYTLQLSGATSKKTLEKWAIAQRIKRYQVIETKRQDQAWFILVSGRYSSPAAAKKAIATLPAAVQAKKPWVKSLKHLNQ